MFMQHTGRRIPFHRAFCAGWFIFASLTPTFLPSAETNLPPGQLVLPSASAPTNPPLRDLGAGRFQLGEVRFDRGQRTVEFPATVNLREGNIEYVIVHANGKTHESLLRTTAEPYHVQLGFLLLGARGAGAANLSPDPAVAIPGDAVTVEMQWTQAGVTNRARVEDFVQDRKAGGPLSRGPFVYTGSRIREDGFAAQLDGSIVSLITDADALVNNPRRGREDDDNWLVRTNGLPPLHTAVEVTIRLVK